MTLAEARKQAISRLRAAGVDTPELDSRILLGAALGLSAIEMLGAAEITLSPAQREAVDQVVARRESREPVGRILGRREFYGLSFALAPDTLEPRPDSETLVDAVLGHVPDKGATLSLLDLGTGTGCLLLALLANLPRSRGIGVDISEGAVRAASGNAAALGLSARAAFRRGNWAEGIDQVFDIIISNPPYIPAGEIAGLAPEVAKFDPRPALDGGADGLEAYRAILNRAPRLLRPEGAVFLELGQGQEDAVSALARARGFQYIELFKDIGGINRCLKAIIPAR
jgi:release factor glutamine methyltransferase